jgi:hypothetical protein
MSSKKIITFLDELEWNGDKLYGCGPGQVDKKMPLSLVR